jgi:hypothetical protein
MIADIFWLALAAPIPAIGFLAYQTIRSWHMPRQPLWALALTGLSAGYTVVLFSLALLASFGLLSAAFLLTASAGTRHALRTATSVLWYGSLLFACVTLLGLVLLVAGLIASAWSKGREPRAG